MNPTVSLLFSNLISTYNEAMLTDELKDKQLSQYVWQSVSLHMTHIKAQSQLSRGIWAKSTILLDHSDHVSSSDN